MEVRMVWKKKDGSGEDVNNYTANHRELTDILFDLATSVRDGIMHDVDILTLDIKKQEGEP